MTDILPGFDEQQSFTIETVVERAVTKGVQKGISGYRDEHCREHLERTVALEAVVFGRTERGIVGLDQRMSDSEKDRKALHDVIRRQEEDRRWTRRLFISAIVVASIGVVFNIVQFIALGYK